MKLLSGGQSGVDRAVLNVAIERGIDYGGWCPKDGWAEDLPKPPGLLAKYSKLKETPLPDPAQRAAMRKVALETSAMFIEKGMAEAAKIYGDGQMRQTHKHKDPRGYAEFIRMLSEHSALGHALTMSMLQSKRPTLWDLEADLKKFSVPLLIIVGDEDESCLDGSVFLKRTAPTAGLLVLPRASHTITTEEPAAVNVALAELFAAAEAGRWMAHRAPA